MTPSRVVGAFDLPAADIQDWPHASCEQVRDAILEGRVSSVAAEYLNRDEQSRFLEVAVAVAREAIRAGRMIDAGHIPNAIIQSEAKRARTLIADGWIGHPFEQPYVIYHTWEEGAGPLLVSPGPGPAQVAIFEFVPMKLRGLPSLMMGDHGELSPRLTEAGAVTVSARCTPSPLKIMNRSPEQTLDDLARAAACNLGDPVWTVLSMLATDGVEVEEIPAPHRLNKQRAAKGKEAIPSRRKVHSGPYVTALLNRAKGRPKTAASEPGHHASPVMHLRRGHPRNLPNGRRVWVRDCIVNAKDDLALNRSHYALRATTP